MPSFSYKDLVKKLKKLGFIFLRQGKGSHEFWQNPATKQVVMLAKHNKDVATGTVNDLAKDLGFKNLKDFENFK